MNEQHADLNGRTVLVLGAGGALGAGLCAAFAAAGAVVTGAGRGGRTRPRRSPGSATSRPT